MTDKMTTTGRVKDRLTGMESGIVLWYEGGMWGAHTTDGVTTIGVEAKEKLLSSLAYRYEGVLYIPDSWG